MGGKIDSFLTATMGGVPARLVLAAMAWFGFLNLYMVRVNLPFIIVAMVRRNESSGSTSPCLSTINATYGNASASPDGAGLPEGQGGRGAAHEEGEMFWDATTQGFVLAGFGYGYTTTQIVGGRLAELYGTRWVFGTCILAGGICSVLSPVAARTHYGLLIALRIVQGILQGVSWPSMHACVARWIPPLERSRFVAAVYFAATLSIALTLPLCGVIIAAHGWAAAFYVTGALSLAWCVFWFAFMHDSPRQHPRISDQELSYIEDALRTSGTSSSRATKLPMKSILTSLPVWAIVVGDVGNTFGLSLFLSQLPTYMKTIQGFSIRQNGVISAIPFLMRYAGALTWSNLGDWLIRKGHLSIVQSRRLFSVVAMWGPGALIIGVVYSGCNWQAIVTLISLALFFNGAVTASIIVNHTDIAPNFSGTLFGFANTLCSVGSFIVPVMVGYMTDGQQTLAQWQKVFWVFIPIYIVTEIFYLVFSSGDVQPWNYGEADERKGDAEASELDKLQGEKAIKA
ncbi:putative inorganic phosphate cotransporter [Penaeus japonicus]|uniref:putative inorganic phosphate cotransporter n=1 Tax=Penaeus japonicus TaxID=27405 RepID=UPI001C71230F|nr:putative inorganic phosphate cotransporter [Penaeus japonicus]